MPSPPQTLEEYEHRKRVEERRAQVGEHLRRRYKRAWVAFTGAVLAAPLIALALYFALDINLNPGGLDQQREVVTLDDVVPRTTAPAAPDDSVRSNR